MTRNGQSSASGCPRATRELESQDVKMVCMICNGKGYIIEKGKEVACPECQGRGEDLGFNSGKPPRLEPYECTEALCPGHLAG